MYWASWANSYLAFRLRIIVRSFTLSTSNNLFIICVISSLLLSCETGLQKSSSTSAVNLRISLTTLSIWSSYLPFLDMILFKTWQKSRSLLSLNAKRAASTKSSSLIRWLSFCSSWILWSSASLSSDSCWAVQSYHILRVESAPPVIIQILLLYCTSPSRVPSPSTSTISSKRSIAHTFSSDIQIVLTHCCFLRFQTLTTPSTEADAIYRPAFNHIAFTIWSLCP